ncbi:MAG: hypothetical protein WDA16_00235 [Candidatus Thermoplasmatota archaeon]
MTTERVERSYDTLVACPHCAGPVNASLEVERGILDALTQLALSPAWDGVKAPALDRVVTRLVEDYQERIQLRVLRDSADEGALPMRPRGTDPATSGAGKPRARRAGKTREKNA